MPAMICCWCDREGAPKQDEMSHVLAAPDFARGGGSLSGFKQVASRVAGVGRRPGPSSVAKDEDQEVHSLCTLYASVREVLLPAIP